MSETPRNSQPQPAAPASTRRSVTRVLGIVLIGVAVLLAWYFTVFYYGWQTGQDALEEKRAADFQEQVERQISLARSDIDSGSYALALRRLEWVLERVPQNSDAQSLMQQAQAQLNTLMTPAVIVAPTATPRTRLEPTPTPAPIDDPAAELVRVRRLVRDEEWPDAIAALINFQWQHPSFERKETDELLYAAYIGLGLRLVEGEQVELGLTYLERAEKLGDLPLEVNDYRLWAELYVQGIAFYSVNWGATVYYFRDLCLAAPFYQSSCDRLYEALVAYGDQYAFVEEWCPAESLYDEAALYGRSQQLLEKLEKASEGCLGATPTPGPIITDTISITGTTFLTSTLPVLPSTTFEPPTPTPTRSR